MNVISVLLGWSKNLGVGLCCEYGGEWDVHTGLGLGNRM